MLTQTLRASVWIIDSSMGNSANNSSAPQSPVSRDSKLPAWLQSAPSSPPQLFVKVRQALRLAFNQIPEDPSPRTSIRSSADFTNPPTHLLTPPSSGPRPRPLPPRTKSLQSPRHQSLRLRRQRPKVERAQGSQIPRGGRYRERVEGLRSVCC